MQRYRIPRNPRAALVSQSGDRSFPGSRGGITRELSNSGRVSRRDVTPMLTVASPTPAAGVPPAPSHPRRSPSVEDWAVSVSSVWPMPWAVMSLRGACRVPSIIVSDDEPLSVTPERETRRRGFTSWALSKPHVLADVRFRPPVLALLAAKLDRALLLVHAHPDRVSSACAARGTRRTERMWRLEPLLHNSSSIAWVRAATGGVWPTNGAAVRKAKARL